mmetsp:Transcript_14225/g.40737  ORF Transcript_14225/g.40737 Transcript_14225/m.40737 type:complete len:232 (-) Transcript_14225:1366-2061(-)
MRLRRSTLASGMSFFCSWSANWAFCCTRVASGREMFRSSRKRRSVASCEVCLLLRNCSRVMDVVRLLTNMEEPMMARKSTTTVNARSVSFWGSMTNSPANCARDQWKERRYCCIRPRSSVCDCLIHLRSSELLMRPTPYHRQATTWATLSVRRMTLPRDAMSRTCSDRMYSLKKSIISGALMKRTMRTTRTIRSSRSTLPKRDQPTPPDWTTTSAQSMPTTMMSMTHQVLQ